jgi:V8-like Glu-specific endopeptidase
MTAFNRHRILVGSAAFCLIITNQPLIAQTASSDQATVAFTASPEKGGSQLDFVQAAPMKLPRTTTYSSEVAKSDFVSALNKEKPGSDVPFQGQRGFEGSGVKAPEYLGAPTYKSPSSVVSPQAFGTQNLPFSTARADLAPSATNDQYPYRASGKLFFDVDGSTFTCSASLIKKGIVVTAAHCVAEFGKKRYYSSWQFSPGYRNGESPYGKWSVAQARVLNSYFDGTDSCAQSGVVCTNDIAILVLNPQRDATNQPFYPGIHTGWYAYGWDRMGYTTGGITHVTQLGYPGCLDDAKLMQRNDAQGVISAPSSNNTVIGSLMCGGSSGGAWLINFGVAPQLTGTTPGTDPVPNEIVGVTSWGSTDNAVKYMGASPFLATNIPVLVTAACNAYPAACN